MNEILKYCFYLTLTILFSCSNDKKVESILREAENIEIQKKVIPSFCLDSDKERTLRLEVKCKSCEVKYSLMMDNGKKEDNENVKGVWYKELSAEPKDIVGLFATKLENGKPIKFTLESIKFKDNINTDSIEVRVYYNNQLVKLSTGNGYAGISMLEIPYAEFEKLAALNLPECIGKNVFELVSKHSKSSPETLVGTNNKFWIVYYEDLNITFTVRKKNDVIEKAEKGKKFN